MKKKKITLILFTICSLLVLGACGNSMKNKDTIKQDNVIEFKAKSVNNVEMKIKEISVVENGMGDKNNLKIKMNFMNNSSSEFGVGGFDFKIKSGSKTYEVDKSANNIGTTFSPGKEVNGNLNFELPKSVEKVKLTYAPAPDYKILAEWELDLSKIK